MEKVQWQIRTTTETRNKFTEAFHKRAAQMAAKGNTRYTRDDAINEAINYWIQNTKALDGWVNELNKAKQG